MPKKTMVEEDIQDRFFDILMDQKQGFSKTPIGVYQKLVYTRYEEVIKNSMPLLIDEISHNELEKSIIKFMKDTSTTPFVWQIPNDYRKFVKKNKIFDDKKYLYELMYYDWVEIEIYMKEYKLKEQKRFSYKKSYTLSQSSRIKRFKYDIIGNEYSSKRENFLVIYYDFTTNDVLFREINQLIYELFKRLNKKQSIGEVLKEICKENDIDFKEAKELLQAPLEELHLYRVFS